MGKTGGPTHPWGNGEKLDRQELLKKRMRLNRVSKILDKTTDPPFHPPTYIPKTTAMVNF